MSLKKTLLDHVLASIEANAFELVIAIRTKQPTHLIKELTKKIGTQGETLP